MDIKELRKVTDKQMRKNAEDALWYINQKIAGAARRGHSSIGVDLEAADEKEQRLIIEQLRKEGFKVEVSLWETIYVSW
ncbi:hypothetical protein MOC17_20690 [Bacillus haynesii]|uniref:hypothetical protein n=1 Tax=Bacillus haynesii TaxID=1925021 RepID=UPI00227FDA47|nr:hypothetical protein [Bacillus haynesii]MCY8048474.1 hypothetical protein [Bacillus haynesii]